MSSGSTPPFKPDEDSGVAYDSVDDYKNDVEGSTEENQQLRQKCETLTSELVTLKAQLQSLKEKAVKDEKEKAELLSTNKGLEATLKEKEEEIAALKEEESLWHTMSSKSYSEQVDDSFLEMDQEENKKRRGIGKSEHLELPTEESSSSNTSQLAPREDIRNKIVFSCITSGIAAIKHYHEHGQKRPDNVQNLENYKEFEVYEAVCFSILLPLEVVGKLFSCNVYADDKTLKEYCTDFLEVVDPDLGKNKIQELAEDLVIIRNAAAHANTAYTMKLQHVPPGPVAVEVWKVLVYRRENPKTPGNTSIYTLSKEYDLDREFLVFCKNMREYFFKFPETEKYKDLGLPPLPDKCKI